MVRNQPFSRIGASAMVVSAALWFSAAAWAGGPKGFGHRLHGPHGHGFGMMAVLSQLELTAEQESQVRERFSAAHGELQPQIEAMMVARKALQEYVTAATVDEQAIRAAAGEVGRIEGELAVLRARLHQELRALLTAEQLAELEQIKGERRSHFEWHHRDFGPPPEF